MNKRKKKITAKEFDRKFDAGEDILPYLDLSKFKRINHAKKRVNVDFPQWMLNRLDIAASRHGSTRQAIIKHWLADRLKAEAV